jgi:hypothetical protein
LREGGLEGEIVRREKKNDNSEGKIDEVSKNV